MSVGRARWTRRGRLTASVVLTVAAVILLLVGGVTLYARQEIVDAEGFADRAELALKDQVVRQAIADEVVQVIISKGSSDLIQAQPLLQTVVEAALDTEAFRRLFRTAAINAHNLFFKRDRDSIALDLADIGTIVIGAARSLAPDIAKEIPREIEPTLASLNDRPFARTTLKIADEVRLLGIVLPLVSALMFALAIAVAPDRRSAVVRSGVGVAVAAGVLFVALWWIRGTLILEGTADDDVATEALRHAYDALLGPLSTWALAAGAFGLVIAAAAASILRPFEVSSRGERLRRLVVDRPKARWARLARGAALLLIGVFLVLEPSLAVRILTVLAGAYAVFFATSEILREVVKPPAPAAATPQAPARLAPGASHRRWLVVGLAGGAAVAVAAVIVALLASGGDDAAPDRDVVYCNGYRELCDRRVDQVTFLATHNSMSAARERGFYFAHHVGRIEQQLQDGARGLLIDAHNGVYDPNKNRVRTDLQGADRKKLREALGEAGTDAVSRVIGRLGFGELKGDVKPWLCHTLCELGATDLVDASERIRAFLERHPDEVLIIFVEDYVPPADIESAMKESGLDRYLLEHEANQPWPTLREMIETGKRVVLMAENDNGGGKYSWYLDGFAFTQDTPYDFKDRDDIRSARACRLNRGTRNSPLFLINHWLEKINPTPSEAREINSRKVLGTRLRRCARRRGLRPNLVAVNFADEGDALALVNELNGIPAGERAQLPTRG